MLFFHPLVLRNLSKMRPVAYVVLNMNIADAKFFARMCINMLPVHEGAWKRSDEEENIFI